MPMPTPPQRTSTRPGSPRCATPSGPRRRTCSPPTPQVNSRRRSPAYWTPADSSTPRSPSDRASRWSTSCPGPCSPSPTAPNSERPPPRDADSDHRAAQMPTSRPTPCTASSGYATDGAASPVAGCAPDAATSTIRSPTRTETQHTTTWPACASTTTGCRTRRRAGGCTAMPTAAWSGPCPAGAPSPPTRPPSATTTAPPSSRKPSHELADSGTTTSSPRSGTAVRPR
jgi:hypothetical protein